MPERVGSVAEIASILASASSLGVVGHVGPDGDALGSMVALALAARSVGIDAVASFDEPFVVPDEMSFLDTTVLVAPEDFPEQVDVAVVVDTSVPSRVGSLRDKLDAARHLGVIDHHISDGSWGDHLLIDRSAAAAAELVYEVIVELGWEITPAVATAIYTGIVPDTGRFQYASTSPRTHEIAADLLAHGVHPDVIGQKLFEEAPFGYYRVAAHVLERATLDEEHAFVWSILTREDLADAGVSSHETEGLIDLVRMARGTQVACLLKVKDEGVVKGSLRSRGLVDVAEIAAAFGGGGHHNAAGFTAAKDPEAIIAEITDMLP